MASPAAQDPPLLPHTSLNPSGSPTIILLHGLLSTPLEYTHVHPHLMAQDHNYHVLLPSLPAHGSAAESTYGPFTLPNASAHIARLIRQRAPNGTAHVAGLSAGGMVALHLAKHHPELVSSLFVTGVGGVKGRKSVRAVGPYVLFLGAGAGYYSPAWLYRWGWRRVMGAEVESPEGAREESWRNASMGMLRGAFRSFGDDGGKVALGCRTLVVAGGRGDHVEGCRGVGRVLREGNVESRAVVVEGAVHGWDLQFPEVFAKGLIAWVEARELPAEYKVLE